MNQIPLKHGECDMAIVPMDGEKPFKSRSGRVLLYCYDTDTSRHLYLDVATDMPLTNEEAWAYDYFNQEK